MFTSSDRESYTSYVSMTTRTNAAIRQSADMNTVGLARFLRFHNTPVWRETNGYVVKPPTLPLPLPLARVTVILIPITLRNNFSSDLYRSLNNQNTSSFTTKRFKN